MIDQETKQVKSSFPVKTLLVLAANNMTFEI